MIMERIVAGAPPGKRLITFVDDLNMPKLDTYGSQPPIELLRQYQDFGFLYDREKLFLKEIHVSTKTPIDQLSTGDKWLTKMLKHDNRKGRH